jgi:lipoprotein-anchoring transpeptidase ErfK/SrfK
MRRAGLALILAAAVQAAFAGAASAAPVRDAAFSAYEPGTIVIKTAARQLYLVVGNGEAIAYPVAVGKPGKQWTGVTRIDGKFIKPAWTPPAEIKADKPDMPDVIPSGSPANPMGAAAMTLNGGEYAIHGTNNPNSIGHFASYGCIRMHNRDILDLYSRVDVGTPVVVIR